MKNAEISEGDNNCKLCPEERLYILDDTENKFLNKGLELISYINEFMTSYLPVD